MKIVEAVVRNGLNVENERVKLELNKVTGYYDLPPEASRYLSIGDIITIEEREIS